MYLYISGSNNSTYKVYGSGPYNTVFNGINPFPNTPFWDRPKFREAADDNWKVPRGFLPHNPDF